MGALGAWSHINALAAAALPGLNARNDGGGSFVKNGYLENTVCKQH